MFDPLYHARSDLGLSLCHYCASSFRSPVIAIPLCYRVSYTFFSKLGSPSLCIEEMHTTCFYVIYSTKTSQRPYNDYTSRSHQKKVSKHHQTSTNARGLDEALCLGHRHRWRPGTIQRKRLVCKLQRLPPPLSANPSSEWKTKSKTLTRTSIDATTTPDGATALRESIKPRSLPIPHSATLSGLIIVDVEDATPLSRHRYHPLVPLADAQLQEWCPKG
jgi:hypothetical protein